MKILVVEDERKLAEALKQGLQENGYAVDVAPDGRSALDQAAVVPYDCVLLDLMLPGLGGDAVCRELRLSRSDTPILVLTARTEVGEKIRVLDLGADDYLTKPFAFTELLARIRALLRRGRVEPNTVLKVSDLELDPSARRVRRGERDLVLTAREFSVLEYLMRNAGHVVTRGMIADHVWDSEFGGQSNVVDVYINYLRRKIDQGFEPKLIQT